ncbi:MAG: hypothetical protein AAF909_09795 [Pseudomonadota bacterium]
MTRNASRRRWRAPALTVALYAGLAAATMQIAPLFGREPLPCFGGEGAALRSASPLYCALNRHYATPEAIALTEALAAHVAREVPGAITLTLDASFPFINGFPLLPHLSHDDGEKIDIAFYYLDGDGRPRPGEMASPLGYWGFEQPRAGEAQPCAGRRDWLTLRWDMDLFQPLVRREWRIDPESLGAALRWLAETGPEYGLGRVLIEPHLLERLEVDAPHFRFQGCRAARHDDHIHYQLR